MQSETDSQNRWSNTQAYGLATICLVAGTVCGYLIHGPAKPLPVVPTAPSGATAATSQMPVPTMDQMKHMAQKQAEPLMEKLKQHPDDPALLAEVGRTYLLAHQFEPAIEYYEKSAKIKPDPKVLTSLGGVYHFAGNDDKAIDSWNRALKVQPGYADALVNIGLVEMKSDPQAAIKTWKEMLAKNPNHPQRAKVEQMISSAQKQLEAKIVQ